MTEGARCGLRLGHGEPATPPHEGYFGHAAECKSSKSQSAIFLAAAPKLGTRDNALERKAEHDAPL